MIKCGNRKQHGNFNTYHVSTADVKACFAGRIVDSTSQNIDLAARAAAEDAQLAPEPAEARELTANEASALDRMRKSGGYSDDDSAYWKALCADEPAEGSGPVDEGNWAEQVPAHSPQPAVRSVPAERMPTRLSPKGREMPTNFGGTPKQYDLLFDLNAERGLGLDLGLYGSVGAVSKLITAIFEGHVRAAEKPATAPQYATEDGIYRNPTTGEIFKLQFNRASGDGRHLYAKRLVINNYGDEVNTITDIPLVGERPVGDLVWLYVGAISKAGVLPAWRVTRKEAAAFGALYGVCVRCGRDLTAEESIDRAMGPVCAGKMGW